MGEYNAQQNQKKSEEKVNTVAKRVNFVSVKLVKDNSFLYKNRTISDPHSAYELVKELLEGEDREKVVVGFLNTKNQPVALHVVSVGSINSSILHPREIFKAALLCNAASLILFHNHPSGDPTPSTEDFDATKRIKDCGKLMGIEMIDHIVIGDDRYYSMIEKGIF